MSRLLPPLCERSRRCRAALLALIAMGCRSEAPLPSADPDSRRASTSGEVVGLVGSYGNHVWRGIPYAQAPVGALRWRAPVPLETRGGLREALQHGPLCPQLASSFGGDDSQPTGTPVGEEDCLYLDVYAPRMRPEQVPTGAQRRPVMVWIHGGGNVLGGSRFYDGGRLAAEHGVIVVAIQYRLGPLGWFRHAALRGAGDARDDSGNYGTLDQIRALEWVRDHIASFGGDPQNVTIFGESAGGRNVFALLMSPLARGLFQRAIVQSGGTDTTATAEGENAIDAVPAGHRNSSHEILLRLFDPQGESGRAATEERLAELDPARIAELLRERSAHEILLACERPQGEGLMRAPQVFADGHVLPAAPALEVLALAETSPGVPLLVGSNRDENRLFLAVDPQHARWYFRLLPRLRDPERFLATADALSRMWKVTGVDRPAQLRSQAQPGRVYAYRFDWDEEPDFGIADLSQIIGAAHGLEIPFVFGHWDLGKRAAILFSKRTLTSREALAKQMMSYWTQFARSGAPGDGRDGDQPEWKAWSGDGPQPLMIFDSASDGGVRLVEQPILTREQVLASVDEDPRLPDQRARCDVYRSLVLHSRGLSADDYARAGRRGCAAHPLERWPWEE